MSEYIEREVALELIESAGEWGWSKERLYDEIQDVPSADVTPVVHGHWKWNIEKTRPFCSKCAEEPYRASNRELPNYCPNCGAKMDSKKEGG